MTMKIPLDLLCKLNILKKQWTNEKYWKWKICTRFVFIVFQRQLDILSLFLSLWFGQEGDASLSTLFLHPQYTKDVLIFNRYCWVKKQTIEVEIDNNGRVLKSSTTTTLCYQMYAWNDSAIYYYNNQS